MTDPEHMKEMVDYAAVAMALGAFAEVLPAIAALFALIWTLVRVYEWARYRFFGKDSYFKDGD
tara:strand:- start:289 stop:477 length:189 start_codon:yes stop_codon:yes gene_type:complete